MRKPQARDQPVAGQVAEPGGLGLLGKHLLNSRVQEREVFAEGAQLIQQRSSSGTPDSRLQATRLASTGVAWSVLIGSGIIELVRRLGQNNNRHDLSR